MPTNAEIKAAIDLIIRSPHNHILTGAVADILDDIVDNITGGPGGTPGIDDVLAEGQVITANRTIELDVFQLLINRQGVGFLEINPTVNSESVVIKAFNATDDNNSGYFSGNTTATTADAKIIADFNDGIKTAQILAQADASLSTITHTADEHIFNTGLGSPSLNLAQSISALRHFNNTDNGNESLVAGESDTTTAKVTVEANFNDGVKVANIIAISDATTSTITHTADTHKFDGVLLDITTPNIKLQGVNEFADNAAAIAGGVPGNCIYFTVVSGERILKMVNN